MHFMCVCVRVCVCVCACEHAAHVLKLLRECFICESTRKINFFLGATPFLNSLVSHGSRRVINVATVTGSIDDAAPSSHSISSYLQIFQARGCGGGGSVGGRCLVVVVMVMVVIMSDEWWWW
jgi:hypothetical protein